MARRALLVLASTLFAILLAEAALRLLAGAPRPFLTGAVDRYAGRLPAAPGTDRRWFAEDPPPLPNRRPVDAARRKLYDDYQRRGVFVHEADQAWNRHFLETQRCAPSSIFDRYPPTLRVFDPPAVSPHPRYRFLPNITTAGRMVVNEFGLRGPPLALARPAGAIRVGFLGASTTVSQAYFAFSYPERVVHWLNRWAAHHNLAARFEGLNMGRYGMMSSDIAAIVRDELLPLDPDLAVFYEGANHFFSVNGMVDPWIRPRARIDPNDPVAAHVLPAFLRSSLRTAELTDRALNGFSTAGEPLKPRYRLKWPAGVDEQSPDPAHPDLPLDLTRVFSDLETIRRTLDSSGARLLMSSFVWMAAGDLALSPARHRYLYEQLNTMLWPLRYADIRRMADFQNRAYRRWASDRKLDFLDVAADFPLDPGLFVDGVHMTEDGERLRAWIVFQRLVPILKRMLDAGELPRAPAGARLPPPPSLTASEATTRCGDAPSPSLVRVDRAVAIETIAAYDPAEVRFARTVEVVAGPRATSYAALVPVPIARGLAGPHYVLLRARVLEGRAIAGVLERLGERKHSNPMYEKLLTPELGAINVYVPVFSPGRTDTLVIANAAEGVRSRVVIEDVALMAASKDAKESVLRGVALDRLTAVPGAAVELRSGAAHIAAKAERWSYAARASLGYDPGGREGITLRIRARVLEGQAGFRILDRRGGEPLTQISLWPSEKFVDVIVPLPAQNAGDLMITNVAAGNVPTRLIVEKIEVWAPD